MHKNVVDKTKFCLWLCKVLPGIITVTLQQSYCTCV